MNAQHGFDVVSKGKFAELKNVSPGRVSQWIAEGKIGADALVGDGRKARIRVSIANEHLRRKLDAIQSAANGLDTKLAAVAGPVSGDTTVMPAGARAPDIDPIEEQIKRERLEGIRRDNRKKAEDEGARAGRYVSTDDVRQQMGRVVSEMENAFEGELGAFASAIAAEYQLSQRDVLHLLRAQRRASRERTSAAYRQAAEKLPELVEVAGADLAEPETV